MQPGAYPPSAEEILSITDLTRALRELLEKAIGRIWVAGEVSNFRRQSSGHCYFTLKDEGAQLSAVMFRAQAERVSFRLADGQQVIAFGELTVYEAQGKHQIVVRQLLPAGQGDLQAQFEALKRKLQREGLFESNRKKPLPLFPESVVLVTSPTGAALQDMLQILARRAPQLPVFVFPVRVQGAGAAAEIAAALDTLSRWHRSGQFRPDAVVLARGGGSLEDLWAFNEEIVARALASLPIPTITGIGHEIDFSIADFVADRRAPTPSAAVEMLILDRAELLETLAKISARLDRAALSWLATQRLHLHRLSTSPAFREPARVVEIFAQRVDDLADRLARGPERALDRKRRDLRHAAARLTAAAPANRIALLRSRLGGASARLELLNPLRTLDRGFALLTTPAGDLIRSATQLLPGAPFHARLADGSVDAQRIR